MKEKIKDWFDKKRNGKKFWKFILLNKGFFLFVVGFILGLTFAVFSWYIIIGVIALIIGIILDRIGLRCDQKLQEASPEKEEREELPIEIKVRK